MEGLECSKDVNPGSGRTQQRMSAEMAATETALRCPRCDSTNTKFCYYNNYSKLQPRHYCRACRRHWTAGGTLRSVPVGGSRKNKRLKTDRTASADKEYDSTTSERNISPIESSTKDLPLRQCENNRGGGELGTEPWMPCGEPESTWWLYQDTACLPFASFSSSSCSASLYDHSDDGLFAMQSSARQPPSSNLSHWDDILDLVNLELKAPAPERVDQTLSY